MIYIRKALKSDIDSIMNIEKDSFIPQIQESKSVFEKRIEFLNETFLIFTDSDNNEIIGYLSGEFLETIPSAKEDIKLNHLPSCRKSELLYISSFAISPSKRGQGIGNKLFSESINYFLNNFKINEIILLVNESWVKARTIYEKQEFEEINIFKNFFKTEKNSYTNGILMKKSFI